MKCLFDVDGTLITFEDKPQYHIIKILRSLHSIGVDIYVSSGGGVEYAEMWLRRLKLDHLTVKVLPKGPELMEYGFDLSFDDEKVQWAKLNLQVSKQKGETIDPMMCEVCDGTGWKWEEND